MLGVRGPVLLVAAFSWDLVDLQESERRFSMEFLAISVNYCLYLLSFW